MKRILLTVMLAFGMVSLASAQAPCTPGPNYGNGIYPDSATNFVDGCLGQPYSQVVSVKVPTDTTAMGMNVTINYIQITGVTGLPQGLSYECSTPDCKFAGGTNGCAVVHGTIASTEVADTFHLNVAATANATAPIIGAINQNMPVTFYRIIVKDCSSTGINSLQSKVSYSVYPNPAFGDITIGDLSETGNKEIQILNMEGKLIDELHTTSTEINYSTSSLKQGIYFVKVKQNGISETAKLVVE